MNKIVSTGVDGDTYSELSFSENLFIYTIFGIALIVWIWFAIKFPIAVVVYLLFVIFVFKKMLEVKD